MNECSSKAIAKIMSENPKKRTKKKNKCGKFASDYQRVQKLIRMSLIFFTSSSWRCCRSSVHFFSTCIAAGGGAVSAARSCFQRTNNLIKNYFVNLLVAPCNRAQTFFHQTFHFFLSDAQRENIVQKKKMAK